MAEDAVEDTLVAHPDAELESVRALERRNDAAGAAALLAGVLDRRAHEFEVREEAFWFHLRHEEPQRSEEEALALVQLHPSRPEGYLLLGNVRLILGRLDAAIDAYAGGCRASPGVLELERAHGDACLLDGRLADAQRSLHIAATLAPREARSHFDIGRLREAQGRYPDALQNFERALAVDPEFVPSMMAIGSVHGGLRRWPEAIAQFERAHALAPADPNVVAHLGNTLLQAGDMDAAEGLLARASEMAPASGEILSLLGGVDYFRGRYDIAGERLKRAVELAPGHAPSHYNLSLWLLLHGDYEAGWAAHEHGLETEQRRSTFFFETWDGAPLPNGCLYVSSEQGLGDEVMFGSCLPDLVARGDIGRIVVGCDPRLKALFGRAMPSVTFIDDPNHHGEVMLAPHRPVDRQVAIGSLPRFFRRQRDDFPARDRFLEPDAGRVAHFRDVLAGLGDGLKVGISWRGGGLPLTQGARSIELADWAPLLTTPGARFVNLQYGDSGADISAAAQRTGVTVHDAGLNLTADIDGLCALMSALDVVISIDNSTVHLAGAVGAKVWAVLPPRPDWRWTREGSTSPWYRSLRLVRRGAEEPVQTLMTRLRADLEALGAEPA